MYYSMKFQMVLKYERGGGHAKNPGKITYIIQEACKEAGRHDMNFSKNFQKILKYQRGSGEG